jgi:hypothetical protein
MVPATTATHSWLCHTAFSCRQKVLRWRCCVDDTGLGCPLTVPPLHSLSHTARMALDLVNALPTWFDEDGVVPDLRAQPGSPSLEDTSTYIEFTGVLASRASHHHSPARLSLPVSPDLSPSLVSTPWSWAHTTTLSPAICSRGGSE